MKDDHRTADCEADKNQKRCYLCGAEDHEKRQCDRYQRQAPRGRSPYEESTNNGEPENTTSNAQPMEETEENDPNQQQEHQVKETIWGDIVASEEAEKEENKEPPPKANLTPKPNVDKPPICDRNDRTDTIKENIKTINKEVEAMVKAKNSRGAIKRSIASTPEKEKCGQTPKHTGTKTARRLDGMKPK